MRLVCPNCEAKYEVPDDAIPDTGRDVQCTNCGHTWFQMRGRTGVAPAPASVAAPEPVAAAVEPADPPQPVAEVAPVDPPAVDAAETVAETLEADLAVAAPPDVADVPEAAQDALSGDTSLDAADPEAAVLADASPADLADAVAADAIMPAADSMLSTDPAPSEDMAANPPVADAVEAAVAEVIAGSDVAIEGPPVPSVEAVAEAAVDAATATPVAAAYAVDESVLAILREEAEREANARRADTLESQTDLGIDAAMPRKAAALAEAEAKPSARRDLLPDVEEINSTLRPSDMQADGDGTPDFVAPPPEAPRGFRSGFLSLMTVAILAAALYLVAPRLAVLVPGLAGPLETYVSVIDSMRLGLDGMMRSATVAISDG